MGPVDTIGGYNSIMQTKYVIPLIKIPQNHRPVVHWLHLDSPFCLNAIELHLRGGAVLLCIINIICITNSHAPQVRNPSIHQVSK